MYIGVGKGSQHIQVRLERIFHHDLGNVAVATETFDSCRRNL